MSGYCFKQDVQRADEAAQGDKGAAELRMTSHTQQRSHGLSRTPSYGRQSAQNQDTDPTAPPPSSKPSTHRGAGLRTPPKSLAVVDNGDNGHQETKSLARKSSIPRAFLNHSKPTASSSDQQSTWNPSLSHGSLSHVRTIVHDSPLYARRPNASSKPRGFFSENDPLPQQKSSASSLHRGPASTPSPPSRIPIPRRNSPSQSSSTTSSIHSVDSTTSTTSTSTITPPSSLPPPLDDDDAPHTPTSTRKPNVDPPRTPNHINPDQGLSAPQKVRVGLSGLLLTSEAFRNSTGINSTGRTKRDASPGRTRAQNLSEAPLSPTHSRTSSQGSLKVRTEALVTKLIPTKNSVHSLIGYIKELQSSEASLRTHLEAIKSKAQEDLARSHGAVNKLQSSVRQIEEERDQKASELARKSHEIDTLQAKIEALRVALEKNNPALATTYTTPMPPPYVPPPHVPQMATIQEAAETPDPAGSGGGAVSHPIHPDIFRGWLVEFFSQHDTSRLPAIDTLMRRYHGRDKRLIQELHHRYGLAAVESLAIRLGLLHVVAPHLQKPPKQHVYSTEGHGLASSAATPAPVPFVMAPEAFHGDQVAAPVETAQPAQQQTFLTSCIGRHSKNDSGGSDKQHAASHDRREPFRPPPAGSPPKDYVPHHVPPPRQAQAPPAPGVAATAEPNAVNVFQKPRSPRQQKPRPAHAIHDPFAFNHPQPQSPPSPVAAQPSPTPTPASIAPTKPAPVVVSKPSQPVQIPPISPPLSPVKDVTLLGLLTDLYKTHQPDKLKDVKTIVSSYTGHEVELIRVLKAKYGALSVKKLEHHLLALQALGASARAAKSPSILWRLIVLLCRSVLLAVVVACCGVGYFGISSHLACREATIDPFSSSYCQNWHISTARLVREPSVDAAQDVLDLVPQAWPIMASVGHASAARSAERTLAALRSGIKHIQQAKPMAVPDFRGLELLDDFARVLEMIVKDSNGSAPSRVVAPIRAPVVDIWAIMDLADVEAAKQMNLLPSTA